VHLKIGTPVIFRINRQLVAIECPCQLRIGLTRSCKVYSCPLEKSHRRGTRGGFFLFHSGNRAVSHQSFSAAGSMVFGHALCQDPCAEL